MDWAGRVVWQPLFLMLSNPSTTWIVAIWRRNTLQLLQTKACAKDQQ